VGLLLGVGGPAVLPTESLAAAGAVQVSTTPALFPAFNAGISDYVLRCTAKATVQVSVSNTDTSGATTVSVDGQTPRTGTFTAPVSLNFGQAFEIAVIQGGTSTPHYVRCLPSGFPTWTTQRSGTPQAAYYVAAPSMGFHGTHWVIIYDTNGVPMWWMAPASNLPVDAKLVQNAGRPDVLWTDMQGGNVNVGPAAEEHSLDGSVALMIHATSPYNLNPHEVQLLGDGDYLVVGDYAKSGVNLSSIGGPTSATILDDVVEEVTVGGSAVWTWDAYSHVGINEVDPQWWSTATSGTGTHDVYHINSAVTDFSGNLLVSLRYTDAVFYITNPGGPTTPGRVIWKLGGTTTAQDGETSLKITDPSCSGSCFGGQHYARFFNDGDGNLYVTLHDNGTGRGRGPRAVRYQIDAAARTATRVEQVTDSTVRMSPCCGSAAKLPGGDWVMSWGGNPLVAEYSVGGSRVFSMTFASAYSYRADAVLPGVLTRDQLRSGMNAQYPRP